ncbi:MAG: transcriptional regulator, TetR family [Frankiales bacterium]|nr:transcriptional regulator, TetR family [Frankiales bacterium]
MSTGYLESGRAGQKQRTRRALVLAAQQLVADGVVPTVEDAAARAGISRTTAYRYFENQHALLAVAHPETAATSFLPPDAPAAIDARLDAVLAAFTQLIVDTEAQQRMMLRLSLEQDETTRAALPLRQGRAIAWIGEALEPLTDRLTPEQVRRLTLAIRSVAGIEALVWLTDVAALSRDEATALMRWSAGALLRAAQVGDPPPTS